MILAGAGGHSLEITDILQGQGVDSIRIYGEIINSPGLQTRFSCLNSWEQVAAELLVNPNFCLAVGNPQHRGKLFREFTQRGGIFCPLRGLNSLISPQSQVDQADILHHCFVGPAVQLSRGVLINSGAQVHHEVKIGEFSVINPAAVLLGACQVGDFCSVGANATILPGIKIGNHVTIGAGAVIIRDVPDGATVVGVPGRVLPSLRTTEE